MHILFVCTGNIFRSMTAEYALRAHLGDAVHVASAGTADRPELTVRSDVAAYLAGKGLDVSAHRRRMVTSDMIAAADRVIPMHVDHQRILAQRFGHNVPVYLDLVGAETHQMPDVDDLFQPDQHLSDPAILHVRQTIDRIIATVPALADRLGLA